MNSLRHIESCRCFKETYPYVNVLYGLSKRQYLNILKERLRERPHKVHQDTAISGAFGWRDHDVVNWLLLSTLSRAGIEDINSTYI